MCAALEGHQLDGVLLYRKDFGAFFCPPPPPANGITQQKPVESSPTTVVVSTHEHLPPAAADRAVRLVAVVVVLICTFQEAVLQRKRQNKLEIFQQNVNFKVTQPPDRTLPLVFGPTSHNYRVKSPWKVFLKGRQKLSITNSLSITFKQTDPVCDC